MIKTKVIIRSGRIQVKCKASAELAISMHEIEMVNNSNMQGVMYIDLSGTDLVFTCPVNGMMSLDKWMGQIKGQIGLAPMLRQVCGLVQQLLDRGMDVGKACFHPGLVFIEPQKLELYFIYLPYNGYGHTYDPILFLKDLSRMQGMDAGMFTQRLFALRDICGLLQLGRSAQAPVFGKGLNETGNSSAFWGQEEEVPTGLEEEEPPTGVSDEGSLIWADEEPLTSMGDEDPFIDMGQDEPPTEMNEQNWGNTNPGMQTPMLIRINRQESSPVNKSPYIIGRSQQRADFCIPDNPKIGNAHAILSLEGGTWYLEDPGSKNGTFIGGQRLRPNQRVKLYNHTEFYLFNEPFRIQL